MYSKHQFLMSKLSYTSATVSLINSGNKRFGYIPRRFYSQYERPKYLWNNFIAAMKKCRNSIAIKMLSLHLGFCRLTKKIRSSTLMIHPFLSGAEILYFRQELSKFPAAMNGQSSRLKLCLISWIYLLKKLRSV